MRPQQTHLFKHEGACVFHEPSANTQAQDGAFAEGGSEGHRRFIFDLENISEHEKAAGAKSEGLTIGPCCDYNESKPVLLCDLEIVFLVLMRLRDAIPHIEGIEGRQVHRSWWVARGAVEDVRREGRNVRLVLGEDLIAPVSRAQVSELKTAGWF